MQAPTQAIPQENQRNLTLAVTLLNEQHIVCINNGWLTVKPSNSSLMEEACDVAFLLLGSIPSERDRTIRPSWQSRGHMLCFLFPLLRGALFSQCTASGVSNIHVRA